jgi:predicted Rossmann fold flavoprotein
LLVVLFMDDVIVIGAGPAGMVAAVAAGEANKRVRILERMQQPGRKLLLSGGSRCNITNNLNAREFVQACGPAAKFLHNAVGRFDPRATMDFFAKLGVRIRVDADGRCYPAQGGAKQVLDALQIRLHALHIPIKTGVRVVKIEQQDAAGRPKGKFWPFKVIAEDGSTFECANVIIATGGMSYPVTGSSGDGYALARDFGHKITPTRPGEVGLTVADSRIRALSGLSVDDVLVTAVQGQKIAKIQGPILFTHFGISGPAVLDISRLVAQWQGASKFDLLLDLQPNYSANDLDLKLAEMLNVRGLLATVIAELLPERLAQLIAQSSGQAKKPPARLSAADRRKIVDLIKRFPVSISGNRGFAEAIVTVGGVDLEQINPKTMESKLVPGIYFCGEVLDLDGPRGGFNLQIAWSTGWAAGTGSAS